MTTSTSSAGAIAAYSPASSSRAREPYYVLFPDDYTHVKFYRVSLADICRLEGNSFDAFDHADWQPADEFAGPYELS